MDDLFEKINNLPNSFGCYLFLDKKRQIIYIGKSKNIKKRVKQYFSNTENKSHKIVKLVKEIDDVCFINSNTESDALLLECYLIKKNKPKFNSMLKNNLVFPLLMIDYNNKYPFFRICYKKENIENVFYFGFFYSESEALRIIDLICSIWKISNCQKEFFSKNSRSCLNYHIGKCLAPCEEKISSEDYKIIINDIILFLNSKKSDIIKNFNIEMKSLIEDMYFEKAKTILEKIENLKKLNLKIRRINNDLKDKKVFILFRAFNEPSFSVFYIENEIIMDRNIFNNKETLIFETEKYLQRIKENNFFSYKKYIHTNYILEIVADKVFIDFTNKKITINTYKSFFNIFFNFINP